METAVTTTGDEKKEDDNRTLCSPQEMMKSLKNIFSGIRHEIGNPINSIKMTVSVLKENIDRYPREKIIEYIDRVLTETDRIEYLLRSLKNFSMYEELSAANLDLTGFMNHFLEEISPGLKRKEIRLKWHVAHEVGNIQCDARALQQILQNIINNAVDSLEGIEDPVISIDVAKIPGQRRFIITDNGCGISPAHEDDIFKPFFSTSPRKTGLGLSIVQTILARMGGTILIHSEVDKGTSAIFHVPEVCLDTA